MDSLKPLYWHQGLFLQPQHFQHLQTNIVAVAHICSEIKTGIGHGISELEIDEEKLADGCFSIEKLKAVFPDGTLISYPENVHITNLTLSLTTPNPEGFYDIYISLVPLDFHQKNISEKDSDVQRRFIEEPATTINDHFDQRETAEIKLLRYDVRLFVGHDSNAQSGIIEHVARVFEHGNGFHLALDFIPNVLCLGGSTVLQKYVNSLLGNLVGRFEQLESFTTLAGNRHAELNSANLINILAMNTLANFVPVFSQYSELKESRVEDIYLSCRQLVSQLSMFSKRTSITGQSADSNKSLLPFARNNLGDIFSRVFILINQLLDELTIDPEKLIELTRQGEAKFISALSADFLDSNTKLYLRLRTEKNVESALDDFAQFAKMGADGQVDIYTKRALPGIGLTYLVRKPMGVASAPNSYYFGVDRFCFEWQKVIECSRLALIWPTAPEDLCVELIAVRG